MATTDTNVSNLIVNKLTLSQYKTAKSGSQIVDTESYEITDIDTAFLESSTKYAANIDLTINSSTYVVTAQLKDQNGNNIGNARTIDLPLESVVVSGSYDNTNKKIVLTLQNGSTIDIPVGDLIAGLQSEITAENPLAADLVDDSTSAHKFVTAANKTTWNNKQDALVSGTNIKTVNNNSLLGAGNINIDSLPAQSGQSGKFLTTNGTAASWANVDALPTQTGQSGKFLTTNGTTASWSTVPIPVVDGDTVSVNSSNELQAIGIIEKNAGAVKHDWVGTFAQWQAGRSSGTIPDTWFCYIIDDESTNIPTAVAALANRASGNLDSGTM